MDTYSVNPPVSITLPIARDADVGLLAVCLQSVQAQTYTNTEVIALVSTAPPARQIEVLGSFPTTRVIRADATKTGARNLMAKHAKGDFLVFLDVDMELPASWIADCVTLARAQSLDAVITPIVCGESAAFWEKCRSLEKELLIGDQGAEGPLFVRATAFSGCGGFDESLDPLDDWILTLSLRRSGAVFGRVDTRVVVRESTSFRIMFSRKYLRGRFLRAFRQKYPGAQQLDLIARFKTVYLDNWKILLRNPPIAAGLILLKIMDMAALWLGSANPPAAVPSDGTRVYFDDNTARQYEQMRHGTAYNRYKHYAETKNLVKIIPKGISRVVDVGSGTGRITRVLTHHGLDVYAVEPSTAMVRYFRSDSSTRAPVIADGRALPFARNSFDASISIRVAWHLPTTRDIEAMLAEMSRVATSAVVIDIANSARWRNPLIMLMARIYFGRRSADLTAHSSTRLLSLREFAILAQRTGLEYDRALPLDLLTPVWLDLMPNRLGTAIFPAIYAVEQALRGFVPAGRYLVSLSKIASLTEDATV